MWQAKKRIDYVHAIGIKLSLRAMTPQSSPLKGEDAAKRQLKVALVPRVQMTTHNERCLSCVG